MHTIVGHNQNVSKIWLEGIYSCMIRRLVQNVEEFQAAVETGRRKEADIMIAAASPARCYRAGFLVA